MKNKQKLITTSIIVGVILIISLSILYIFTNEDKNSTLTLLDKQWIESNKNKVIDFGIVNNIPVFNAEGTGVFFDFFTSLTTNTKLEFNKVPYDTSSSVKSDYAFKIVNKASKDDIIFYQDNYVLLTKTVIKYNKLSDIQNITIGVLNADLDKVNKYLEGAVNVTYKTYTDVQSLLASTSDTTVNAVVLPKNTYLAEIISNGKLNIAYNITELTQDYVITLGKTSNLNVIINKYFKKWYKENYTTSYNQFFTENYFNFSKVDSKEKAKFLSKRYIYGFIENLPYVTISRGHLAGINNSLLKEFSKLTNVEISYKGYSNTNALLSDFNSNNIDFFYANNKTTTYKMDVFKTIDVLENKVVIASPFGKNNLVNSLESLVGKQVLAVKDSKIAEVLTKAGIIVKTYDNLKDLISNKGNEIIAIDSYSYIYYARSLLANYNINYEFSIDYSFSFISRDIKANTVFNNFFNFYLTFVDERAIVDSSFYSLYVSTNNALLTKNLITYGSYLALLFVLVFEGRKYLKHLDNKKIPVISKSDKLKYVDILTSLKNRNYLNDNIEKWDSSELYPQTIIIIDLNNVAYINDNYGHQEGDNTIKEAANILITNQISNSEIIRTNGNEFLVYLVEYDDKQVISYMRKLAKEFKELNHGFGAAMGYSIINDAIKTVDDAINEATIDMRHNKEEAHNESN